MKVSRTARGVVGIFYLFPDTPITAAKTIILAIICLCLCSTLVRAQSMVKISGYIFDASDGRPIGQAAIRLLNTNFSTISTDAGYFAFSDIPEGTYRAAACAEGYEEALTDRFSVVPDITTVIEFRANRKIYSLPGQRVGAAAPSAAAPVDIITRDDIQKANIITLTEALKTIEGVFVQESGGGGRSEISIRGCDPKHVLVLIDGQRINAAGSGTADVSAIPLEIVESVEVFKGGESARFGSDAIGGVINIHTMESGRYAPEISTEQYFGIWNNRRRELTLLDIIPVKRLSERFHISSSSALNDFGYSYSVSPRPVPYTGVRKNSETDTDNLFLSAAYRFSPFTNAQFSGQLFESVNGLPGAVSAPDTTAWKRDRRLLVSAQVKSELSSSVVQTASAGFSRFTQYFNNIDEPRAALKYETRSINDIGRAEMLYAIIPGRGHDVSIGLSVERSILYNDDLYRPAISMGRSVRDNAAVFLSDRYSVDLSRLRILDAATISASLRGDNTDTKNDGSDDSKHISTDRHLSKKLALSAVKGNDSKIIIRASYGDSFRLPSMNALFWKGDVRYRTNRDLRPETAEHSDIGIELNVTSPVEFAAGMTYFHSFVTDLIVWQPSSPGNIWEPVNLDAARITGHEEFLRLGLFDRRIEFSYQNTITVAKNRKPGANSFNNDITFRPHYITQLGLKASWWNLFAEYSIRLVDRRFANSANTKWYDAYRVDDITSGIKAQISKFSGRLAYSVKNLNGENYVLIGQYPMPGREWGISLSLIYNP